MCEADFRQAWGNIRSIEPGLPRHEDWKESGILTTRIYGEALPFFTAIPLRMKSQSVRELAAFTIVYPGKINGSLSILWSESRLV